MKDMASRSNSGGAPADSGENMSPIIQKEKVSKVEHEMQKWEWVAHLLLFMKEGGNEIHSNNLDTAAAPEKKLNAKVTGKRTPRPRQKYRSLAMMYSNDKGNVIDSSYINTGYEEVNEKEDVPVPCYTESLLPRTNAGLFHSIFLFLWAVRIALITPPSSEESSRTKDVIHRVSETFKVPHPLEMMVPLQDLVKAALRLFSSTSFTWKPLAVFDKDTKNWSWRSGSILSRAIDITTPEAWGLSDKTLNKLVDSFIKWVKAEYCLSPRIILRLPNDPPAVYQPTPEERFKNRRYIRNVCTVLPRSVEAIAHFHKEEEFRYFIPEYAFEYTAADGKKATVAPLRCTKTTTIRDHFILKPVKPLAFNILCLVRDAVARLPDGEGSITDICSLVKDSQYIQAEDVSDDQLKHVVSKALDTLHYELDHCVKYDKDTCLWTYRHAERVEDDFTSDCTSSTKTKNRKIIQ